MKFPTLFKRETTTPAVSSQDRAERLLVESFRLLSRLCSKLADLVEAQRLERAGYEQQERFLKRVDKREADPSVPRS